MTKIILCGCNGVMGRVIDGVVAEDPGAEIVAGVDLFDGVENSYPVFKDISEFSGEADAIIDFSKPEALPSILDYSVKTGIPAIIASTGYSEDELESMREASKKAPILFSGNMSLGVNVLIDLLRKAVNSLPGFDIEIIEKHHNKKVDSPSGTARMLADAANEELNGQMSFVHGRVGNDTKRTPNEIGVHAVRGGSIVGEHTVIFAGVDEIVEIKHTAMSKKIFAVGSVRAAHYMTGKPAGLYSMSDLFSAE
ncbi:4-hydroxy-tetrahydrodipicolinate reductase [Andreesenia angusta]|uniref:4-hydroxy-tetrahydrodipicolinate reductase n=1 Tax=Andreesenia angusta TaxID=39480 RepID=A0A1S1V6G0_9FIRM|nr:4-hydroxy-tetrahydrodipicolinate reductase [Andreesenia angusta]OHW61707.1 4-hydroxy-tetrahydrodipicolinate reductase [Andreesenia angusta]